MHLRWLTLCFLGIVLILEVSCKRGRGMSSRTRSSKTKSAPARQSSMFSSRSSSSSKQNKNSNNNRNTQASAPAAKPQQSAPTQNQANSNQMVHSAPTNNNPVQSGAPNNYQGPHMGFSQPGQQMGHGSPMGQPMGNGYGSPTGYGSPMGGGYPPMGGGYPPMGGSPMGYGTANQAPKSSLLSNVGIFASGAAVGALAHRGLSGIGNRHSSTSDKKSKSSSTTTTVTGCPENDFKDLVSCCETLPEYLFSETAMLACNNNVRDEALVALTRDYVMNRIQTTNDSLMNKDSPASCFTTCLFKNQNLLNEDNSINFEVATKYFTTQVESSWQSIMNNAVNTCNNMVPIEYNDRPEVPGQCNNEAGFLLQCTRRKLLRFCPFDRLEKSPKCVQGMYDLRKCSAFERAIPKAVPTNTDPILVKAPTETTTISTESTTSETTTLAPVVTMSSESSTMEVVSSAGDLVKNLTMDQMLTELSSSLGDADD